MRIPGCALALVLSAIGVIPRETQAADFQVLYAEPIALRAEDARSVLAASQAGRPQAISFDAYGRRFDLELESNERLLSRVEPERRAELSRYELLRGRLTGLPGSWVRLTRIGSELRGAIWDGNDLYFIEPARITARFAVSPLGVSGSTSVVYRLSDTQSNLSPRFCGVRTTGKESSPLADYKALVAELRANAALAAVPGRQIELAVIGDFEFFTRYQSENPQGVLLATMNIVDGIFGSQVGVTILLPTVTVFNDSADPFTTNVAENLLDELATYRQNTPEVRNRGLAHLITGRALTANTAGIAYLDALCDPFFGVGLSEDSFGSANTALIAAHEIGHNFGAPHDAEPGSVCASVPPIFIMAPEVNGSTTFSQCSLDQMLPRVATAACVTRSSIGDGEIAIEPTTIEGLTGDDVPFAVRVDSVGTAPVRDVTVTIQGLVQFQSATVPGGTCSVSGSEATCQLGTIDEGSWRQIEVTVRSVQATTANITARLTASNDGDVSNDTAQASVIVAPAADMTLSISPPAIDALTRQTFALNGIVTSTGPRAVTDVVATIRGSGLELVSATSDGGTCTTGGNDVTCSYGTVAPGAAHRIDVQYRGMRAGGFNVFFNATASNDGEPNNNGVIIPVRLEPARDVTVRTDPPHIIAQIAQPFSFSADVLSVGPETVNDVVLFVAVPGEVILDSLTMAGSTCTVQPASCVIGAMPSGTSRRLTVQAHGTGLVNSEALVSVQSSDHDQPQNDSARVRLEVRHGSDVALHPFESRGGPEGRSFFMNTPLRSLGVGPATDIAVNVAMPASFAIQQATLTNGTCSINANTAACTLSSLASGAEAHLLLELRGALIGAFNGTITATAANDGDPSNNVQNITLQIIPFIDVGVDVPIQTVTAATGELFVVPFTVVAGPQPVSDVVAGLGWSNVDQFAIESMTPSVGSCSDFQNRVQCALGTLPAQGSATVTVGLRARFSATDVMGATVHAFNDMNASNNSSAPVQVVIENRGNAAVRVASTSATGTVNQVITYPTITVSADRSVDAVFVDISLPPDAAIQEFTATDAVWCMGGTCNLGTITPGIDKHVTARVIFSQAGTLATAITLRSTLDTEPQDNSATVSVTVNAVQRPPASDGGGGGGGTLGLVTLLGLVAPAVLRRKRTRVTRTH